MKIVEIPVDSTTIDTIYQRGEAHLQKPPGLHVNSYCILRGPNSSAHARFVSDSKVALSAKDRDLTFNKISARDAAQKAFFDSLHRRENLLTVGQGRAGSGKTCLTMAWAFDAIQKGQYKRLILTKPNSVVGNTFGFGAVPGDLDEKYAPFLASYEDTFHDLGLSSYVPLMLKRGDLQFRPVQYLRGTNLAETILIIDEMQNLTWHELKTILTRAADGSKVVAMGDPSQIDVKLKRNETGFHTLVSSSSFANAPYTSWITFEKQYRTSLCELVENIDSELGFGENLEGKTNT